MSLSEVRKSLFPSDGDSWDSIAERELSELPNEEAVSQLQSWNLHVFMRPASDGKNPILPCDIIFLEPPRAS